MFPKQLLVVACVMFMYPLNAQRTVDTLYYTDWTFYKQRTTEGRYARILVKDGDYQSETQKDLKTGQVYVFKAYKGDEPCGVWKRLTSVKGLEKKNYNFQLEYCSKVPRGVKGKSPIRTLLFDIRSIGYKKPTAFIKGQPKDFRKVFRRQFKTPRVLRAKSLRGGYVIEVDVKFQLAKDGSLKNIKLMKGQNPVVDKEIVRTLRSIQFEKPASLNGQPIEVDVVFPVRMQIRPNAL